jgi:hypothetical protein
MEVGPFAALGNLTIPAGIDVIETSGYRFAGSGGARYILSAPGEHDGAEKPWRKITANDRMAELFESRIDVRQLGAVGDSQADDTAAINQTFALAAKTGKSVWVSPGFYRVSTLVIEGANGLNVWLDGDIVGRTTGEYDAVLTIRNSANVFLGGRLALSCQYNPGYACAVAIYSELHNQAANIQISGFAISGARLAFRFGRPESSGSLVSEIVILGGWTYGCPSVVAAFGSQTVISFVGAMLISNHLGGDAAWRALPQFTIRSVGAAVQVVGGEVQHNQVATDATLCIEPVLDPTYGNVWGSIFVCDAAVESASRLAISRNPRNMRPVAGSGIIHLTDCWGYHSADDFALIETDAAFDGRIYLRGNNLYAAHPRSKPNIRCLGAADIEIDAGSFGRNFLQGLGAIVGGLIHFDYRIVLSLLNTYGQALAAGSETILRFRDIVPSEDSSRFTCAYDPAKGRFVVPPGGLKMVTLQVVCRTDQPEAGLTVAVFVSGQRFSVLASARPAEVGVAGSICLGDLAEGATIELRAVSTAAARFNLGPAERVIISARR